jgi:L-cysteine S-thiosulfotransferase
MTEDALLARTFKVLPSVFFALLMVAALCPATPVSAQVSPYTPSPISSQAPAPPPTPTPEQDRASVTRVVQQKFPGVPIEEWSLGGATFTPGTTVTPLGGANATNTNDILAIGKRQWDRKFQNGKSFASCFPNGGRRVAATYPQIDPDKKTITTLEIAINDCLKSNGEPTIPLTDTLTMGALSAYLHSLSVGQRLNIRTNSVPARERYDAGRRWFTRKMGERDLACASCHVLQAGQLVDNVGISPAIGQTLSWPRVEPGGKVRTLHQQFQRCMSRVGAEPFAVGSDEFNNLQFFLASLSQGLPLRALMTTQ